MVSIKLSDEQLAALGFGADAKPEAILSALQNAQQTRAQLQQNESSFTASLGTITQKLDVLAGRLDAVEARKPEFSAAEKDALLAKAKEAAEAAAGTALINMAAKLGGKPAGQADKPADVTSPAKPDKDSPKAKWDSDADLRAQFGDSFEQFEAYENAVKTGRLKIFTA